MNHSKEYRKARLNFLYDLMQDIAELEPRLLDMTDWHTNSDALSQFMDLVDKGEI